VCGRGVITAPAAELSRILRADIIDPDLPGPSWNVTPTQTVPLLLGSPPERRITPARWSLVPSWSPQLKLAFPTFNARSETAAKKPTFRSSVENKRCVILFDGYYEWKAAPENETSRIKTPFYIHTTDSMPLLLAGLYSWWRDPESLEWHLTATILTRPASGMLAHIHDRMPVMVPADLLDDWLNTTVKGSAELIETVSQAGLTELPRLAVYEVAALRGNGPELIKPVNDRSLSP